MEPSDWTSLPSDLIRRVADLFLATSDVDYYMSLRAVCRNWRAATDDPSGPDPRFSPRGWVLVASLAGDDETGRRCLFLHVNTGRFLWKDLLRYYICVASTEDGHLIVLEPASKNSRICLLNPMTGRLVSFPVTTKQFFRDDEFVLRHSRNMFATGTSSMVLYSFFDSNSGGCIDLTWDAVYNRESLFKAKPGMFASMVPFKGRAYAVNKNGKVVVVEHNCRLDEKPEVTTIVTSGWNWKRDCSMFLVDNAGELLLVSHLASEREMQVFRVDLENGRLEEIKGVGNRAIFLGKRRCLSVDAYNFRAIESNCIYYIGGSFGFNCGIYAHCLNDGSHLKLFDFETVVSESPKSLARVLMEYACY